MRIRSRSIIIMVSRNLRQASTIALGIVLVRLVSKEVVGTYNQVFLVYTLLAGLLSLQIENSLYYFIPKLRRDQRGVLLAQTFLTSLTTAAIIGATMFFAAVPIARLFHNPTLAPLIRVFSVYPFFERLIILIPAFMISLDKPIRAGAYSLAEGLGRTAVVIIAILLGQTLMTVLWLVVLVEAIVSLLGCLDMVRLSLPSKWALDLKLILNQWQFTWPLWATTIVGMINIRFDKLLISSFFNPSEFAVYNYGAIELPIVATVTASVSAAMMPDLVTLVDQGKKLEALSIWQEGARKCSLLIFPCFAFFIFTAQDFIVLLFGQAYRMAAWPFSVYLCMLPIRVTVYATMFRAMGRTKPIAVSAVLAFVLNVIISVSLMLIGRGSLLSFVGPSIGTTCATLGSVWFLLWQLSRIMGISVRQVMRWKELGRFFLISLVPGLIVFLIPLSGIALPVKLAIRALIFMLILAAMTYWTHSLHDDEKELLITPFMAFYHALRRKKF